MIFSDRRSAGRRLADDLAHYRGQPGLLVLALPRGGVPVGYEVARALDAPLDVLVVRKLGVPGHPEYAVGALATGGLMVLNDQLLSSLGIDMSAIEPVIVRERSELERRERAFRGKLAPLRLQGRSVLLVDDGVATGASMRVAIRAVRAGDPARVIVAAPLGSREAARALAAEADAVHCSLMPEPFGGVGLWYQDFSQTTDAEVSELLGRAYARDPVGRNGEVRSDGHAR
jgi:putative phosphoribosyl transferase